jgi:hypothetical protein
MCFEPFIQNGKSTKAERESRIETTSMGLKTIKAFLYKMNELPQIRASSIKVNKLLMDFGFMFALQR